METLFTVGAGPVDVYPEVRAAFTRRVPGDDDPDFLRFYERVDAKLTRALRTATPAVILQSEAILGIEAAAAALIARDDVVLNLASGLYGKGFGSWAARFTDRPLLEIEVPDDEAIDPAAVEAMFASHPEIRVVSVVHHETPTGCLNPVREIGAIVRRHGAFLIVDAVSSFGGMDVHPDDIQSDVFVAGSAKCLGSAPGLTLLGVSARGWEKIAANPAAPFASILSIKDWREAHHADRGFPFTPLSAEVHGLDAALDRYLNEGPPRVWARHAAAARAARAGARAMGLALWPRDEAIASPTLTALRMPAGVDARSVVAEARRRYGVMLSAGVEGHAHEIVRIGHMGPTAHATFAVLALCALGGARRALGSRVDVGSGTEAALAAADAAAAEQTG
ncbi:MAG: alanine--glyoxylate aminotransferase family protein [Rhodospirillaceae bacterium]|nr:alanine--glyoxylate aminotransferase family protein [Rhodospirillaceae bacterium]